MLWCNSEVEDIVSVSVAHQLPTRNEINEDIIASSKTCVEDLPSFGAITSTRGLVIAWWLAVLWKDIAVSGGRHSVRQRLRGSSQENPVTVFPVVTNATFKNNTRSQNFGKAPKLHLIQIKSEEKETGQISILESLGYFVKTAE